MADVTHLGSNTQRPRRLLRTTLGEVLRGQRLAQGRTLREVARAAKVSMPYLSEVERGRKEASSEVLGAVCDALRIDLADLVTEVGRVLADPRTTMTTTGATAPARSAAAQRTAVQNPVVEPVAARPEPQASIARHHGNVVVLADWASRRAGRTERAGRTGQARGTGRPVWLGQRAA